MTKNSSAGTLKSSGELSDKNGLNASTDKNDLIDDTDENGIRSMVNRLCQLQAPSDIVPSSYFAENERCALLFYGLPRAFKALVLPSVIRQILIPNAPYDCHIFVHYHYLNQEPSGRSGHGGRVSPDEVFHLQDAARWVGAKVHGPQYQPTIRFRNYTDEQLWHDRGDFLNKTRHVKDDSGENLLYFPWKVNSFIFPQTSDNIVRMWHGTHSVWQLMMDTANDLGITYKRVAMLRDDVVFVTPIDILLTGVNKTVDVDNHVAVVPNFARWPVNDRTFCSLYF